MDEDRLSELGQKIGHTVKGGEVLELIGDVGAGKTTLTKAVAVGMGIMDPIQSPTFTISNRYVSPDGVTLAHYDFYRLNDAGLMKEELDETIADETTVTVIEWGDIINDVLPADRLSVHLIPTSETERQVEIVAHGPTSETLKEKLV